MTLYTPNLNPIAEAFCKILAHVPASGMAEAGEVWKSVYEGQQELGGVGFNEEGEGNRGRELK